MASTRTERRHAARTNAAGKLRFSRLPGSAKPFKHALKLMDDMRAVVDKGLLPIDRQLELEALPPLVHRGHGGRHRTRQRIVDSRQFQDRSKYDPREEDMKHARESAHPAWPEYPVVPDRTVPALCAWVDAVAARTKHDVRAV